MRRRTGEVAAFEPPALVGAERLRRKARTVGEPRDRFQVEAAFAPESTEHHRTRRLRAHQEGAGRAPAQRVVDETGDGRAVARAGEPVREAPRLERIGGGPALGLDRGDDLDGGGQAGGGCHAARPSL